MDHSTVAGETFDRTTFNANITMQDLVDSYLLPFQVTPHRAAPPYRAAPPWNLAHLHPHPPPSPGVRGEGQGLWAHVLVQ